MEISSAEALKSFESIHSFIALFIVHEGISYTSHSAWLTDSFDYRDSFVPAIGGKEEL